MRFSVGLVCAVFPVLAGCPSSPSPDGGGGQGGGSAEPDWQVIFDEGKLDRALLSIWGSSSKDVYAVGGPLGNTGFEALVLRYDGSKWSDLRAGGSDTFWWVHGSSSSDVWMVGERGRIAHYDGSNFVEHVSGVTATLWGVFAFSPTDVWAVGGTPEGNAAGEDDLVLHYDGTQWQRQALPGASLNRALFKVWGTSANHLYIVGEAGIIWQRSEAGFELVSSGALTQETLFTVTGCGDEVFAVGGRDVFRQSGGSPFAKLDVSFGNNINGVACARPGSVAVVGFGGQKKRLAEGQWVDDFLKPPSGDLHAVWADETGAFWTVGGNFITQPKPNAPRNGIVARYGAGRVRDKLQ